jgi:hypothetical protein
LDYLVTFLCCWHLVCGSGIQSALGLGRGQSFDTGRHHTILFFTYQGVEEAVDSYWRCFSIAPDSMDIFEALILWPNNALEPTATAPSALTGT